MDLLQQVLLLSPIELIGCRQTGERRAELRYGVVVPSRFVHRLDHGDILSGTVERCRSISHA
jgi:hypothetical protein